MAPERNESESAIVETRIINVMTSRAARVSTGSNLLTDARDGQVDSASFRQTRRKAVSWDFTCTAHACGDLHALDLVI